MSLANIRQSVVVKKPSPLFWRALLTGLLLGWWHFIATILLSGRGEWHPYWRAYPEDLASVVDVSWQAAAGLSISLAGACSFPWVLPSKRLGPPGGWRTWLAIGALLMLVPQLSLGASKWLGAPALAPAEPTVAEYPTRPMLWIIVESADAGLHLPKVDARRHDYYGVLYSLSVPSGPVAGVWAQICGDQLDAAWSGAQRRCLVDGRWHIIHGRSDSRRLSALLASTGAKVVGGEGFKGYSQGDPDAALLAQAKRLSETGPERHVLVLAGDTGDVTASDAAIDAAIGEWLGRGGVALVTANRPRRHEGWRVLPARLYGVRHLDLPSSWDVALQLGKAAPGRLMGGLRSGTLYDVGCTAWELAGFGCRRVGHGISLTREPSITLGLVRL